MSSTSTFVDEASSILTRPRHVRNLLCIFDHACSFHTDIKSCQEKM
ncbi:unnamed protein product [Amoebophrya sp. A25]|nr:unnamed protein product [Amoebophrya sp. A25]|eukprot:GSA25T00022970001.1